MSDLDNMNPLPKFQYRVLYVAYPRQWRGDHFVVQYKKWWWFHWRTDGHWSIGSFPNFYERYYANAGQASDRIAYFIERSNEPIRHDKVVK